MRIKMMILALVMIFTLGTVLTACGSKSTTQPSAPPNNATVTPATGGSVADGQTLLNQRCTRCHSLTRVINAKHSEAQWSQIVSQMVRRGAQLSGDEENVLVAYLAKTYGQ